MRSFYNGGSICINPNIWFKCFDSIKLLLEVAQKGIFVLSVKSVCSTLHIASRNVQNTTSCMI